MVECFNLGIAIENLKAGNKVTRTGWNGNHYLELQVPDENSKMNSPYIFMRTEHGQVVPWVCSQTDMLADDWHLFYN